MLFSPPSTRTHINTHFDCTSDKCNPDSSVLISCLKCCAFLYKFEFCGRKAHYLHIKYYSCNMTKWRVNTAVIIGIPLIIFDMICLTEHNRHMAVMQRRFCNSLPTILVESLVVINTTHITSKATNYMLHVIPRFILNFN